MPAQRFPENPSTQCREEIHRTIENAKSYYASLRFDKSVHPDDRQGLQEIGPAVLYLPMVQGKSEQELVHLRNALEREDEESLRPVEKFRREYGAQNITLDQYYVYTAYAEEHRYIKEFLDVAEAQLYRVQHDYR